MDYTILAVVGVIVILFILYQGERTKRLKKEIEADQERRRKELDGLTKALDNSSDSYKKALDDLKRVDGALDNFDSDCETVGGCDDIESPPAPGDDSAGGSR